MHKIDLLKFVYTTFNFNSTNFIASLSCKGYKFEQKINLFPRGLIVPLGRKMSDALFFSCTFLSTKAVITKYIMFTFGEVQPINSLFLTLKWDYVVNILNNTIYADFKQGTVIFHQGYLKII